MTLHNHYKRVIILKLTQNKPFFEMIMESLYGLCNSKLQQICAFIYYDLPGPLLVKYSNAYRTRKEHQSSEMSIMQTITYLAL